MKKLLLITLTVFLFTFLQANSADNTDKAAVGHDKSRVKRGFNIAPVPLNTQGKNRAFIGLGSYLVNAVGGCNDCHTCPTYAPGHNPFDGIGDGQLNGENHLAGGINFGPSPEGGEIISANLTPDSSGRPAGLELDEFITLIRTGHDPDDSPEEVLQVMPWALIRQMTDHDLRAIYEYLRAVPHATPGECAGPGQ